MVSSAKPNPTLPTREKPQRFSHTTSLGAYQKIINSAPGKTVGVNIDPANFVWMGIDTLRFVRTFGDRIYGVHAKDTEIFKEILGDYGVTDGDKMIWWRYRTAGWGEFDWRPIITTQRDFGYSGDIHVEAEDPVSPKNGSLAKAAEYLRPMLTES